MTSREIRVYEWFVYSVIMVQLLLQIVDLVYHVLHPKLERKEENYFTVVE